MHLAGANLRILLDVGNTYLLYLVTTAIAVEKPAVGVVTLATSVLFGEAENNTADARETRRPRQNDLTEDNF